MAEASSSAAPAPAPELHAPDTHVPNVHVEAEDSHEGSDADSAFGDELQSYTTSLKSTVLNYRYENGRRYHGFKGDEHQYFLPNDEPENDRLDLYHHISTLRMGGELHFAPIGPEPGRILDIGTGTGIWAIDMGDKYPTADILGNDISPIQPSLVPPNVKFEVDDIEEEWVYSSKFDFIHSRYLACTIKDWSKLMNQAWKFTKPGGWVEFQDFDCNMYTSTNGTFSKDSIVNTWSDQVTTALRKMGIEPDPGPQLEDWVKQQGFINVQAKTLPFPIGTWPKDKTLKEVGAFNLISFLDNLDGMVNRLYTNFYKWSLDEQRVFTAQLRSALKDPKQRIQHNFYVVYGQKPHDAVD